MALPWTMIPAGGNPVPNSLLKIRWAEEKMVEIEIGKKKKKEKIESCVIAGDEKAERRLRKHS